jgi:hypothetical protein
MTRSIHLRRVLQLSALVFLTALSCASNAQLPGCSYGHDLYSSGSHRVSGANCQNCVSGHWITIDTLRPSFEIGCFRSDSPSGSPPALSEVSKPCAEMELASQGVPWVEGKQCSACGGSGGGVFAEGATRMDGKQCWICKRSAWVEADAVQYCGAARSLDEQRVVPSPLFPIGAEGPGAGALPGLGIIFSLKREEFTALEAMIDASARTRGRLRDGSLTLAVLFDAYGNVLPATEQWEQQLSLIHKWRRQSPRSAAAALIEARYWISYAAIVRRGRFSAGVPPDLKRIVDQRAAKARSVLEASKPYAAANPLWYHEMLTVATLQRWPAKKKAALFEAAVNVDPSFDPTYIAMATSLAPYWGGSIAQYQRFVDNAVEITRSVDGEAMYATLYWHLTRLQHEEPFTELEIPWPNMRAGFIALLERYPESVWNLQNFAAFACRAGDGKTFLSLLPKLSASSVSQVGGAWEGAYTFEYCRNRYTKPA